jgi:hypothetical protein
MIQDAIGATQFAVVDADGAVFFARQLEHVLARSIDVVYADLVARDLFPVNSEAGPGATSITYQVFDKLGMAKIITAYAQDLPRADISGKEVNQKIRSVGISYGWNRDEIEHARFSGTPIDTKRSDAARRATAETEEEIAWGGDAASGLVGLLSNPNIPNTNTTAGSVWTAATPAEILADINNTFTTMHADTLMKEQADTLLLPVAQYNYIATTPRSDQSDMSILSWLVANSPFLGSTANVVPVNRLNNGGVGAGDGADMFIIYKKDPMKLELHIPQELEFFPPQERGLELVVPGRSRIAGTIVYYPLSVAFTYGI